MSYVGKKGAFYVKIRLRWIVMAVVRLVKVYWMTLVATFRAMLVANRPGGVLLALV